MVSWFIFVLSLAGTLALQASAAMQASFTPIPPDPAVATPFVGSAMTECMHFCLNDTDFTRCGGARACVCSEPKFQQAVAACLQTRCSCTELEAARQLQQKIKCQRAVPTPAGKGAGANHNQDPQYYTDSSVRLVEVGSSFVAVVLLNVLWGIVWGI